MESGSVKEKALRLKIFMKISTSKILLLFTVIFYLSTVSFAQSSVLQDNFSNIKLKILKFPLPEISDEVRKINIQGTIALRVEFKSDSKIGKVQPVSKMPYLTESVVESAKKIEFEPEIKEGKQITVLKLVLYNFNHGNGWNITAKELGESSKTKIPKCEDGNCSVILKVEFLPSGIVGKVEIEQNLCEDEKSGQEAIEAAKKMNFEPARKNGKPIKQTKRIKYTFCHNDEGKDNKN